MKLQQLHEDAQALQEGILQRAIAAAAMVLGSISPSTQNAPQPQEPTAKVAIDKLGKKKGADASTLAPDVANIIAQRYKVDPAMVAEIVTAVKKHERPDFPRAHHLLGLIGVESSFNPDAVSKLKKDPARGLTQIRPGAWGITADNLKSIDDQVKKSAEILSQYYNRLGKDKNAALHAYNVGITNHRRSVSNPAKGNPRYVPKVNAETELYKRQSDTKAGATPTR